MFSPTGRISLFRLYSFLYPGGSALSGTLWIINGDSSVCRSHCLYQMVSQVRFIVYDGFLNLSFKMLFPTELSLIFVEYAGGHKLFDAVNKPSALLCFWLSLLSLFLITVYQQQSKSYQVVPIFSLLLKV